jgi:5-methylcytosine-specific restriction protein B
MEGLRPRSTGGYEVRDGVFLTWNRQAAKDPANRYVLLVEELSRADLPSVLGELMTFIEHREDTFTLPISQLSSSVSSNLVVLATMNPRDRSALEIDEAMIRRLRFIDCPPDVDQLGEMLSSSLDGDPAEVAALTETAGKLFTVCRDEFPDTYESEMPFGHGIFDGVRNEQELVELWEQRIKRMLYRSQGLSHPFAEVIRDNYPWRKM